MAENALRLAHTELQETNQHLEFLIRVSRRLSIAKDEDALADVMLELPLMVVPAVGCSLVRYDEQEQPRMAIHRGELEPEVFETWVNHLSTSESIQVCQNCSTKWATESESCPLIDPLMRNSPVKKVYCLELGKGNRQFGVLNIYLSNLQSPTSEEIELLETMGLEMSMALETMRLRSLELDTLFRLQKSRKLNDLRDELTDVIQHVVDGLDVSGGAVLLLDPQAHEFQLIAQSADPWLYASRLVNELPRSELETDTPFSIPAPNKDMKTVLVTPLRINLEMIGCQVLWAKRSNTFTRRQIRLISTVAGQMAMLVENHRLYTQVEHQAALSERARLAREIHDGLAQTLGYLQLRFAQINHWMEQGRTEDAALALREAENLLDEAYTDAREAIDGLRLQPGEDNFGNLLKQVCTDFEDMTDIALDLCTFPDVELDPEIQVHLLRIVQEALGNIRKHSRASQASVEWELKDRRLTLQITDNGQGFSPDNIPLISHHGLFIMRERAELLKADFHVISEPGQGSRVILYLPITKNLERVA